MVPHTLTAPTVAGQVGAGAFDLCAGAIAATLFRGTAEASVDGGGSGPCPCGGCDGAAGIPRIEFEGRLMATENFARAAAGLQLREDASLRELAEAASRHCATPWPTVAQARPGPASDRPTPCHPAVLAECAQATGVVPATRGARCQGVGSTRTG